jgi:hypothetical protein
MSPNHQRQIQFLTDFLRSQPNEIKFHVTKIKSLEHTNKISIDLVTFVTLSFRVSTVSYCAIYSAKEIILYN